MQGRRRRTSSRVTMMIPCYIKSHDAGTSTSNVIKSHDDDPLLRQESWCRDVDVERHQESWWWSLVTRDSHTTEWQTTRSRQLDRFARRLAISISGKPRTNSIIRALSIFLSTLVESVIADLRCKMNVFLRVTSTFIGSCSRNTSSINFSSTCS